MLQQSVFSPYTVDTTCQVTFPPYCKKHFCITIAPRRNEDELLHQWGESDLCSLLYKNVVVLSVKTDNCQRHHRKIEKTTTLIKEWLHNNIPKKLQIAVNYTLLSQENKCTYHNT